MAIAIGIIAIGIGIAVGYFLAPKTPTKTVLVTDKGRDIAHDPAKSLTDKDPKERTDKQKEKDTARGKTFIGRADKKANCVGFSLGRGDWEISTTDLDEILEDGYEEVADGKAEVCDIIAGNQRQALRTRRRTRFKHGSARQPSGLSVNLPGSMSCWILSCAEVESAVALSMTQGLQPSA